jgi:hypothetical protein
VRYVNVESRGACPSSTPTGSEVEEFEAPVAEVTAITPTAQPLCITVKEILNDLVEVLAKK